MKTIGSMEMYFPTLIKRPSARISAFVDFGNVYRNTSDVQHQSNCAIPPASRCCGARRWVRFRSATRSRSASNRATKSSACSSPSAAHSEAAPGIAAVNPSLAPQTAAQLASRFGLAVQGDGDATVVGVSTLARARPDQLAFLANPRYRAQLAETAPASSSCARRMRRLTPVLHCSPMIRTPHSRGLRPCSMRMTRSSPESIPVRPSMRAHASIRARRSGRSPAWVRVRTSARTSSSAPAARLARTALSVTVAASAPMSPWSSAFAWADAC